MAGKQSHTMHFTFQQKVETSIMKKLQITTALLITLTMLVAASQAQEDHSDSGATKVILLGTGTPNPDPNHSGCSVAIVVNDTPYSVYFGPGLIRQAAALSPRYKGGVKGLEVKRIKRAFLTHLHSGHTLPEARPFPSRRG